MCRFYDSKLPMSRAAFCLAVMVLLCSTAASFAADDTTGPSNAADARMTARIDELTAAAWKAASVTPAEPASDSEILRRAYLDLTGHIPSVSEARLFLDDPSADKRARLIEQLLLHPAHPSHLSDVWSQFLLPDDANVNNTMGGTDRFQNWLRSQFAANRPYVEMVRELLLATGNPGESGPALFYTSLELKPEKIAASTSRAFLGVQIQCAECHNHPFDKWTQKDFWGYAAFFARVSPRAEGAMQVAMVRDQTTGEVMLPNSKEVVAPRFLLGDKATESAEKSRRAMLADWMTSPENPYFAKAAVNRVWAQLFGRGLVDPPDDMRADHPPRLADVLNELSVYFIQTNYDVRRLFRVLANTQAYQLASGKSSDGERPPELFAAMPLKVLSAEQFYSCLAIATCRPYDSILATVPSSTARRAMTNRDAFVNSFRAPSGSPTEYRTGIPQALLLLNGGLIDDATALERSDILVSLEAPYLTDKERIETLFLATLSRLPSDEVLRKFEDHLASKNAPDEKRLALGDMLWALLNSAEFSVNH